MKVTHILVINSVVREANPYYSANIEPEPVENTKQSVLHFYKVEEVKSYIETHPEILNNKNAYFYKVDEIKPIRTVTVTIDV